MQVRIMPTFISIFPHRTSIVEFPFPVAMTGICVIRMIEQTVVKRPSMKTPIRAYFFRVLICREVRKGMGRKKIRTSKATVVLARP